MTRFALVTTLVLGTAALTGVAHASEAIAYRLPKWKTLHVQESEDSSRELATIKKLGCEVRSEDHGGHTDVAYRSVKWQSVNVADHTKALQLEKWLKRAGFETLHGHPVAHSATAASHVHNHESDHAVKHASGHEESHGSHRAGHEGHSHDQSDVGNVEFRLLDWKTTHLKNRDQADEYLALVKGLGCEAKSEQHTGHFDVSVRCPQWNLLTLPTDKEAHSWAAWLEKAGFEIQHDH